MQMTRQEKRGKSESRMQLSEITIYGSDILKTDVFKTLDNFIQHKHTTTYSHCILVAEKSLKIADKLHLRHVDRSALVRGSLLHDFYLYDWHVEKTHFHGFTHPSLALHNALQQFELSTVEMDIIKKHMFPLTLVPPRYKEAWIVSFSDKFVTILEVMNIGNCRRHIAILK